MSIPKPKFTFNSLKKSILSSGAHEIFTPGTPSYSAGSWWHLSPHTFHRNAPNLARMWYLCVLQQPVGVEAPLKGGLFRVERWGKNGMSSLATVEAEKSTPGSSETENPPIWGPIFYHISGHTVKLLIMFFSRDLERQWLMCYVVFFLSWTDRYIKLLGLDKIYVFKKSYFFFNLSVEQFSV